MLVEARSSYGENRYTCTVLCWNSETFHGVEIPGFGLPNRFFGLTTSCFFRDCILNGFTIKLNNLDLIIVLLLRIEPKATSKLPRQYK